MPHMALVAGKVPLTKALLSKAVKHHPSLVDLVWVKRFQEEPNEGEPGAWVGPLLKAPAGEYRLEQHPGEAVDDEGQPYTAYDGKVYDCQLIKTDPKDYGPILLG